MSGQICLKWNSFLNNIQTSFESLWEDDGLVDVTLASDGQCLTAHKVILSASSPFFKKVFQTNPCQHPVIILQDVHFTELEALLSFIYKGEVNIEQKNLQALLKAAETLQIRGLSNDDMINQNSYTQFDECNNQSSEQSSSQIIDEIPKKKKLKINDNNKKHDKNKKRISRESTSSDKSDRDDEFTNNLNTVYRKLDMKMEPIEVLMTDLNKEVVDGEVDEENERIEIGQSDSDQGEARGTDDISIDFNETTHDKPVLYPYQQLPYADLLPTPAVISTWASSRPMDHLACDIMKLLFTPEERILCNVNGKMGKQQFNSNKIQLIREVLIQFSGISPNSTEWDEAWKNCVTKIDTSNRGLKRYLFQRRSVYTQ
ncbi:hypothetical protein HCN44_005731 [Aphidius gifuensis]|uniref:BTB domain-containing protein n=1 Tax=Aphidius gifuensis TaxID=684658 RepID=A0A834XVM5_APHGI|nr:uncharacterized protein LOC122852818 [Aphidius gifuensis]KAF7992950.1 hypothetical protein HCN44_005731 [Aphidius gifuensis]